LDVARCADRLAIDDAVCDKALEEFLGMTDTTPQGEGPAPRWVLDAPFEVFDLEVDPNGRIAMAGESVIGVVQDGTLKWSVSDLSDASARVTWWKDWVLTGVGGQLRAYDSEGALAWTTDLFDEDAWMSAIEPGPAGRVTVVTGAGQIVRVDPESCAKGTEGCSIAVATVENLGAMVQVFDSGALVASGDRAATLVAADGTVLARREADYDAGAPRDGFLTIANDLLRVHPECEAGSDACFEVLASAKDMELVTPAEIDGVGLAYADSYGVITMKGAREWKIDAGNDADLRSDGTTIYSVGHQLGLDSFDAPPQVRAIDAKTGQTRWITALGKERAGLLSGYFVELADRSLIVSTKTQLFALPL
ncbi:MAG: hypothetical protein AB1Z98_00350, partial [Nannocystaceae bacterium]